MKRKFVGLFLVLAMVVGCLPNVAWADNVDNVIQQRIDDLYSKLGNKFFTVNQQPCAYGAWGHGCDNCKNEYIVNASWFKNMFGSCSAYNFANSYANGHNNGRVGWSCFGFANFAEWYIFKSSNSDQITTDVIGTYNFNYNNISSYAKKGDIFRLDDKHSVIFISATSSGISVLDCNWSVSSGNCKVEKHTVSYSYASTFTICRARNRGSISGDTTPPTVNNFSISNVSSSSFTINCSANETLSRAYVIIYCSKYPNGQAFNIYNINKNSFSTTIRTADYGGSGEYAVSIYIWDMFDNQTETKSGHFNTSGIKVTNCTVSNINNDSFTVNCTANACISRAYVIVYNSKYPNGQAFNIYNINKNSFETIIKTSDYGGIGEYAISVIVFDSVDNEAAGKTGHFNVPIIQVTPTPSYATYKPFSINNNTVTNNKATWQTATVIVAKYTDGVLCDASMQTINFAANETRTFSVSGEYKIFVWDSLEGMKPLAN